MLVEFIELNTLKEEYYKTAVKALAAGDFLGFGHAANAWKHLNNIDEQDCSRTPFDWIQEQAKELWGDIVKDGEN